jgi:hypothetical protein
VLHGHWLARYGLAGSYLPLPIAPEDFAEALKILPKIGFVGGNVTLPHKVTAFERADDRTPRAMRIGAANTLIFDPDRGIQMAMALSRTCAPRVPTGAERRGLRWCSGQGGPRAPWLPPCRMPE